MTDSLVTLVDIDPHLPNRIAVWSDFRLKERVKAVPGAKWSADHKRWTVPLTWGSCLALRNELGDTLRIEPTLKEWASETKTVKAELVQLRSLIDYPVATALVDGILAEGLIDQPGFAELYPFQVIGSRILELAETYIFTDETGTGKSRTALAGLARLDYIGEGPVFPLLVVAPKSMLYTWEEEAARFFPSATTSVVSGTPAQVRDALTADADIYVIAYGTLRNYSRHAAYPTVTLTDDEKKDKELNHLGFHSVIADECHRLKNPESKQTRAFWQVALGARFRVGLTGTPIQDTPEDMWSLLHGIVPEEYGTKTSYVERFLDVRLNRWGGREIDGLSPTHETEFLANLDSRMRRITKQVALPHLPPKVSEFRWVELPPKLRKAYNDMEARLVAELTGTPSGTAVKTAPGMPVKIVAKSNLERSGRLTQMANASMTSGFKTVDGEEVITYTMTAPSPKIEAFMEDVSEGDFAGSSVVVYSDSRQLADLTSEAMTKAKVGHVTITGSVTGKDRQEAIDRFQDGSVPFIIITRAGGEGITLTRANTMVRLVRSWSGIAHAQSEDRVHRIGSEIHDSITIIDYVSRDTVEEGQIVRLNAKGERAQEVLRDDELLELIRSRKGHTPTLV